MAPLPLTCFIIAKNEVDRIERTVLSVRELADEIIVIDSGSSDGTQERAQSAGARVIFNAWPGFGQQKRFGEEQCRNDWLLNLDADEVVSSQLATSIRQLFVNGEPDCAAYGMPALVVYPGQERPRPFARDHYVYRLYDRRRARFKDSTLFDSVDAGGQPVGHLKGAIEHHTVRSLDDLIAKCDSRASYNAAHARQKSRVRLCVRLVTEFPMTFFKYYFVRGHIFGGLMGFQYAMIVAFFRFVRIMRMLQPAGRAPETDCSHVAKPSPPPERRST
jgi:glycosyltransferase involved in cell wall biosynthesis